MLLVKNRPVVHVIGEAGPHWEAVIRALSNSPFRVVHHHHAHEFMQSLAVWSRNVDTNDDRRGCVLCRVDQVNPDIEAMIAMLQLRQLELPVIVVGELFEVTDVVKAFRWGVFDYVPIPIHEDRLLHTVHRAACPSLSYC